MPGVITPPYRGFEHVVTVGLVGGEENFDTIQEAIDDITVGAGEQWVVKIYPGEYLENITLKNGVSLQGEGPLGTIRIKATSGNLLTMGSIGFPVSRIENIWFILETTVQSSKMIVSTTGINIFTNCSFISEKESKL